MDSRKLQVLWGEERALWSLGGSGVPTAGLKIPGLCLLSWVTSGSTPIFLNLSFSFCTMGFVINNPGTRLTVSRGPNPAAACFCK